MITLLMRLLLLCGIGMWLVRSGKLELLVSNKHKRKVFFSDNFAGRRQLLTKKARCMQHVYDSKLLDVIAQGNREA